MRDLKKKYRKKLKKIIKLPKIPVKKKLGRWCKYYEGRLPYPIECSTNKNMPLSAIYNKGKESIIRDNSDCPDCTRNVEWPSWKRGSWDKVIAAIAQGEDLTDIKESFNIKD